MCIGIYMIENTITNKVYVGSSKDMLGRRYHHFYKLRRGNHPNPHLQSSWNKHGQNAFQFSILEFTSTELLTEREDWWIAFFDSQNPKKGYNKISADRREMSEETKAKIGAAFRGRKLTDEHKANISAAHKGKKRTPEHQAKLTSSQIGRPKSDETKAKISAAKMGNQTWLGKRHSEDSKAKIGANSAMRHPDTRAKQSAAKKGKPWSEARRLAHNRKKGLTV